jgi:hypothetical protein
MGRPETGVQPRQSVEHFKQLFGQRLVRVASQRHVSLLSLLGAVVVMDD